MAILQHLAGFGLQQLVNGACHVLGVAAGVQAGEVVAGFLGRRFSDHSQSLSEALVRSADQAWRALEVALAGDSLWDRLKRSVVGSEDKMFRAQVQAFLEATPLAGLSGHGDEFRKLALSELRAARKAGLLTSGRLSPEALAEQAGHLATFLDPALLLDAQLQALEALALEVRQAGYANLAHFLTLRSGDDAPLLVLAVRYFFRRAIEEDRELFQGLAFAQLERLAEGQEHGFAALADALTATARASRKRWRRCRMSSSRRTRRSRTFTAN